MYDIKNEGSNFKSNSYHCVTLGKALNLSGFCLLQKRKQVTYWRTVVRFKWHNGKSRTPVYILYYIRYNSIPTEKKCRIQEFFHLTHLCMLQRPYNFLFSFAFSCQEKKNTTTNMSEEYLGNMHISLHIIS